MPAPRIAFLILAHHDAAHLERLCRRMSGHTIFVHVDGRAENFPIEQIAALPGVKMVTPRTKVHWGDFSMVEATLTLLTAAGAEKAEFDRYVLLSGACYPVKPLAAFEAALVENAGRQWITVTPIMQQSHLYNLIGRRWRMAPLIGHRGLDGQLRSVWNKFSKIMGRNLERETSMKPYFGSQWWALTGQCAASIMAFVKTHPAYVQAYRSVFAPDEHFFQTIVANSEFGASVIAVEDRGAGTNQFTPMHQLPPAEDRNFRSNEADFAVAAGTDRFFIRKVSSEMSGGLLDRIDIELLHITAAGATLETIR